MEDFQTNEITPEAVFTDRKSRRARIWRFVLSLLLLGALGVFGYLTWQWFIPRLEKFGLSVLWINGKVLLILLPFMLFLLFWLFFANLPRTKTAVSILPDGIRKKQGRRDLKIRWDSLEKIRMDLSRSYFLGIPGKRKEKLDLLDAVGNTLSIDARMDRFEDLTNLVRQKAFQPLLNLAQDQLARTGKFRFGKKVMLEKDALSVGKAVLPLSQISSAQIENGWLKVKAEKRRKLKVRTDQVENLDVLMHLLSSQP